MKTYWSNYSISGIPHKWTELLPAYPTYQKTLRFLWLINMNKNVIHIQTDPSEIRTISASVVIKALKADYISLLVVLVLLVNIHLTEKQLSREFNSDVLKHFLCENLEMPHWERLAQIDHRNDKTVEKRLRLSSTLTLFSEFVPACASFPLQKEMCQIRIWLQQALTNVLFYRHKPNI